VIAVDELDPSDHAVLAELVALQRASYRVEADLIGARDLPPLRETPADLAASGERFLGAQEHGHLVGALGWKRTGEIVDIHRLAVHPRAFRRGVATRLLDALESLEAGAPCFVVGTGAGNRPALALYERRGFAVVEEREVEGGVIWVRLQRGLR
jgi:ribosomal protein S18 acetylase RimI-like enzyme